MKRDVSPEAMVGLPVLSTSSALVLCTQLLAVATEQQRALEASGQSLPEAIADAREDLDRSTQLLGVVRVPPATDSAAKREADTALDAGWRNLHSALSGWANTAAPVNPDPEGTKRLMNLLFADGLKFIRQRFNAQWDASQARLEGLGAEPAYEQTVAALGLQALVQAVRSAHADYGVTLGITQPVAQDSAAIRSALDDVCARLRVYVLQVAAHAHSRASGATALAEVLLEPFVVWVSPEPTRSTTSEQAASSTGTASTSSPAGTEPAAGA